jgi:signal transduction histidine kinase
MNWFGYKNISKIIIITIIFTILSNTLLILLFYYKSKLAQYNITLKNMQLEHIKKQELLLKLDVNHIIEMIEFKYNKKQLQKKSIQLEIIKWLNNKKFNKNKNNYLFVYKLLNNKGGDKFARMIINPNRVDLVGKYLSVNYADKKGFHFRKKFLKDINQKGDSFVTYTYKKTAKINEEKISYFKYYKPLNWIIAKGIYKDDIRKDLLIKKQLLKQFIEENMQENIFFFIIFSSIAIIIGYIIGIKIQNIILDKDKEVKSKTKALFILNKELNRRVKDEIKKSKEQEDILMQKSKFIALGETISLIAHQWRQPISELGAIILNIKLHHKLNKLDIKMMNKKSHDAELLIEYISKTIDDFRNFFKPDKMKSNFNINESIKRVLHITQPALDNHNIQIIDEINEEITLNGYQNEFEQVLLNLISNAKDALINDKIIDPIIFINVFLDNKKITIEIKDNANGIQTLLQDKIFEPYFTTKDDANGTGIGLYMSKIIIEKNMSGKIKVTSSKKGSCFSIQF